MNDYDTNPKQIFYRGLLIFIFGFFITTANAQNFQGIAYYEYSNSFNDVDWDKGLSQSVVSSKKAYLRKDARKTYSLNFNTIESSWQEVEALDINTKGGAKGSFENVIYGPLYKNLKEQQFVQETEVFNKLFLLKDNLEFPEWQLTQDEKKIGNYTAIKAFYNIETTRMAFGEKEPQKSIQKVEAWFTPEIPLSHGPSKYWGLPGLILELRIGNESYICNKVELNPEDKFELEIPEKGKPLTKIELEKIIQDKTEEMYSRYKKGGEKGQN